MDVEFLSKSKQMITNPAERLEIIESGHLDQHKEFMLSVRSGLTSPTQSLPCRFFYDDRGSRLFERITELDSYYLTRSERNILKSHAFDIISSAGTPLSVVELGGGNSEKTRLLFNAILKDQNELHFIAIDISKNYLIQSAKQLLSEYHSLSTTLIAAEFYDAFRMLPNPIQSRLFLFMGSNIGNFKPEDAKKLLQSIRSVCQPLDCLLIGYDATQDQEKLIAAYNEPEKITAQFNKNILYRINSELGGNFDIEAFEHAATFNDKEGCVQMWLTSTDDQTVTITSLNLSVDFRKGDSIHTEDSYKYPPERFQEIVHDSGFAVCESWQDIDNSFVVSLLRPK